MTIGEAIGSVSTEKARMVAMMSSSLKSGIRLLDSTNESVMSRKGKCLRPLIVIFSAKLCSGAPVSDRTVSVAAATELLHNATLFHDDVADNSSSRRSSPTVMSLIGGRASVLLGDYWLVKATDRILDADNDGTLTRIFCKVMKDLAEGEIFQLEKGGCCDTSETDYEYIIYKKTASLFEGVAESGAISVSATGAQRVHLKDFGRYLGMGFQIKDDILDYVGTVAELGKPVGQDLLEKKITLPLLGAMLHAGPAVEDRVREKLRSMDSHPENREEIMDFVKANGGIEYASRRMGEYIERAKSALSVFQKDEARDCLEAIADFVADRTV